MIYHYIIRLIQKIAKLFGFTITKLSRTEKSNGGSQLNNKHIKNLKVILDRIELLKNIPKNGIVAELGVNKGDFSNKILKYSKPKKLYLIDIWKSERYNKSKKEYVQNRFEDQIKSRKIVILNGRSENELKKFPNNYFDWVYIDTSHQYDQTLNELLISRLKVKSGGFITGHDYCKGNIIKSFSYGVVQAVNQFCKKYNWEFIYLTHESHRNLSFAIKEIKKEDH